MKIEIHIQVVTTEKAEISKSVLTKLERRAEALVKRFIASQTKIDRAHIQINSSATNNYYEQ